MCSALCEEEDLGSFFMMIFWVLICSSLVYCVAKSLGLLKPKNSGEDVESPQLRTTTSVDDWSSAIAHWAPSNAPSPVVSPSAPIESSNSNGNDNATETRSERIRNRLVFQQVLSLPSYKKRKQKKKKKKSKKAKMKKSDAQNPRKGSKKRTTKNKSFARDIEMGDENNEDEGDRIHRGTIGNFASSLRSLRHSIQLFVFFHHNSTGIDEEEVLESKKAMKDQLACSICLEEYIVGDIVVRLKEDNKGDNTSDEDSGANACKHCFHEDCILEWLQTHDECPLCRVNMLTDTPQNDQS
jgi:hypothetical protein